MPDASPPYATPEFKAWLCRIVREAVYRQFERERRDKVQR